MIVRNFQMANLKNLFNSYILHLYTKTFEILPILSLNIVNIAIRRLKKKNHLRLRFYKQNINIAHLHWTLYLFYTWDRMPA